jgi:hypothetical protein
MYSANDSICRSDTLNLRSLIVEILPGLNEKFYAIMGMVSKGNQTIQDITTLDKEIRFYGPMTADQVENVRELLVGLTGGMK